MNDVNRIKSINQAIKTILKTWSTGKKCLIVYGAGASTSANIPLMSTVYSDLAKRVKKHLNGTNSEPQNLNPTFRTSWTASLEFF